MARFLRDILMLGVVAMVTTPSYSTRSEVVRPLRSAMKGAQTWPNGEVPYVFVNSFPDDYKNLILAAMREIESNTGTKDDPCIRFRPAEGSDYNVMEIRNTNSGACHGTIGMGGFGTDQRRTLLNISIYCRPISMLLHELMHALGFIHEHLRPDRDNYVDVHLENVRDNYFISEFDKLLPDDVNLLGTDYDFHSVLHYGPFDMAKSSMEPTLTPKAGKMPPGVRMGRARYMSVNDVTRVQRLYGCAVDTSHIKQLDPNDVMIDCDFENGDFCQLTQDTQDDYDWLIGQDNIGAAGTIRDYTRGNGKYIYARTDGTKNHVARLISPQFPKGKYCFIFALYMHGNTTTSFRTIAKTANNEDVFVHKQFGGALWTLEHTFWDMSEPWRMVIEYVVGDNAIVDVAVDDVELLKGECRPRVY